jgi:hypothetical protein
MSPYLIVLLALLLAHVVIWLFRRQAVRARRALESCVSKHLPEFDLWAEPDHE